MLDPMAARSLTLFPDHDSRHASTLREALRLFSGKGFFNTSVQDIVAAAGVSVGFIYHNFGDKEGIARALYHHLLARMNLLLDDIEAEHTQAQARCGAVVQMLFELTEAEPDVMGFVIHARHREFLPEEKAICSASAFVRMRGFVVKAIEQGEIRTIDPFVAAAMVYGGAIRMVCLRLDALVPDPLEHYFDELWANTWKSLAH